MVRRDSQLRRRHLSRLYVRRPKLNTEHLEDRILLAADLGEIRTTLAESNSAVDVSHVLTDYTNPDEPIRIDANQSLHGSGTFAGKLINFGQLRPGNSPGIQNVNEFTQASGGSLQIEIGGTTPGPGSENVDDGYDQINVTTSATLDGTLDIDLINDFTPSVGDTFDILTFGSVTGKFSIGTGLYGFGDGSLYFDVVEQADRLQLVVKQLPGGANLLPSSPAAHDALGQFYSDYFDVTAATSIDADLQLSDNVHLRGQFELSESGAETVTVKANDNTTSTTEVTRLTIAAAGAHLFVGTNGPYWTADTNSNSQIDADEINASATGLAINDVNLALAVFRPTSASDQNLYYAINASAASAGLVGTEIIQASANQIAISINNNSQDNGPVIDFATTYESAADAADGVLSVPVGASSVDIGFDERIQRVSSDLVTLSISDFVHIAGSLAFEFATPATVDIATGLPANLDEVDATLHTQLTDAKTNHGLQPVGRLYHLRSAVDTMSITATGVSAFVGINGPIKPTPTTMAI
ncbi:MAG: hypothetical protein R3C28_24875 [Pirellulaceae bacterium]